MTIKAAKQKTLKATDQSFFESSNNMVAKRCKTNKSLAPFATPILSKNRGN